VRHKELKMTNMTCLPLTATLRAKYPFRVSSGVSMVMDTVDTEPPVRMH